MPKNIPGKKIFKRLDDLDTEKKPSLRISNIVYGREKRGSKVYYSVDPKGVDDKKKISESVVLYRWRRRVFKGHTFSGSKLNPKIWRIMPLVFGNEPAKWVNLTEKEIIDTIENSRDFLRKDFLTLPGANVIKALFETCGESRLKALMMRHNDPERSKRFGTPDLFLYATENISGKSSIARFVEVKKPEETVAKDQHEEIKYLQSLGLHARILRLIER